MPAIAKVSMVNLANLEKDIRVKAMRATTKVVATAARGTAPVGKTGRLKKSIRRSVQKQGRRGVVKASGKIAPHAHLVEDGTKPHAIRAKNGRVLNIGPLHIITRAVHHPGAKPNPFLERAAQQSRSGVAAAVRDIVE